MVLLSKYGDIISVVVVCNGNVTVRVMNCNIDGNGGLVAGDAQHAGDLRRSAQLASEQRIDQHRLASLQRSQSCFQGQGKIAASIAFKIPVLVLPFGSRSSYRQGHR